MRGNWHGEAGRLIDAIGSADFPAALAGGLRRIAPFEFTVIFAYVGAAPPLDLHDDFPPARRRLHVEEYQEGPYLLDPFFLASTDRFVPGLWRLSDLAPDRFYQGEYFRSYYEQTGLAEEIGYLVSIAPGVTIVISLMRTERRFSAGEVRALGAVWPVVDAAARRHWSGLAARPDAPSAAIHETIEQAFRAVGRGLLTARERQIVEHTLRGNSAEAVGRILSISPGTVRIHRRNIYSKLRINSQGELFSAFLDAMLHPGPTGETGPAEPPHP